MSLSFDHTLVDTFLNGEGLEGTDELGGFSYRLDLSVPVLATAIHAGHNVRPELLPLMSLDEAGRLFEEDAATDTMIQGAPSIIWGLDSRAEYDLNRPPENALPLTPEQFWGTRVYREQPTEAMNAASLAKYRSFHRFISSYLQVLIEKHGACVVYDIHSYNITRQVEKGILDPPVFNLGTELLDKETWGEQIDSWLVQLNDIKVPGQQITVAENRVFFGRAHLSRSLTMADSRILVLPTEISKIYMNELDGTLNAEVVQSLSEGLSEAVRSHTLQFTASLKSHSFRN